MKRDFIEKWLFFSLFGVITVGEVMLIEKLKFSLKLNMVPLHTTTITMAVLLSTALAILAHVGVFWNLQKENTKVLNTKTLVMIGLIYILSGIWISGIFFLLEK
jgi:hypothetical protein